MRKELQGLKMATIEVAKMLRKGANKSIVVKFIKNVAAAGNTSSDVFEVKSSVLMELGPESLEFRVLNIVEEKLRTAERIRKTPIIPAVAKPMNNSDLAAHRRMQEGFINEVHLNIALQNNM